MPSLLATSSESLSVSFFLRPSHSPSPSPSVCPSLTPSFPLSSAHLSLFSSATPVGCAAVVVGGDLILGLQLKPGSTFYCPLHVGAHCTLTVAHFQNPETGGTAVAPGVMGWKIRTILCLFCREGTDFPSLCACVCVCVC